MHTNYNSINNCFAFYDSNRNLKLLIKFVKVVEYVEICVLIIYDDDDGT